MNTAAELIANRLRELGNAEIAAHSQRFFKTGSGEYGEGDKFLGIRVPLLRKCVKEYREISLDVCLELLKSPWHEVRLLALLLLVDKYAKSGIADKEEIYQFYLRHTQFINNWDLVDCSAGQIVGCHLYSFANRNQLYKLVASENLWERRIAIISTFYFIRKNDFQDTLKLAELLLEDGEDLIHKAVGWMLREVGKRNLSAEENFLDKHYKQMPRTMLRYAIERLPDNSRLAYLRGTK